MSEPVLQTANAVKSIVAPGPIPGSRLSASLKSEVPDWDPVAEQCGVRSLSVPDIHYSSVHRMSTRRLRGFLKQIA
jgi:hypothetical protein